MSLYNPLLHHHYGTLLWLTSTLPFIKRDIDGMRTPVTITDDMRKELECRGLELETVFVDDGSQDTLVMVFRVEPLPGTSPATPAVVKFSKSEFAIPVAEEIQLGTLRYYREYEGEGEGIRDEMEGRFQEDISPTLLRRMGPSGRGGSFSAQVVMGVEDQWVFCTSVVSKWAASLSIGQLGKCFSYECGTQIRDPGAFAQELGAVFASHTSWDDVQLAGHHKVLQLLASVVHIRRTIHVYHGAVCYPAASAEVVRAFPEYHQPAIVPFQKRPDFEWEREYRFVVNFLGEPQAKKLRLPITAELRGLASVVWQTPT